MRSYQTVFYISSYVIRFGKCKGKNCGKERFLFNALNVSIYENDIAILKVESPELLKCQQKKIWPACLPNRVKRLILNFKCQPSLSRILVTADGRELFCLAGAGLQKEEIGPDTSSVPEFLSYRIRNAQEM